jgi:hypothetical protein
MHKPMTTLLTALVVLATSAPAHAQRFEKGRPSITLFTGLNYTGQSITLSADSSNLRDQNFDEAAGSLVARGDWQVCLDPFYGTRCRTYSEGIPDLRSFRGRISSVRYVGRGSIVDPRPGGGFSGPPSRGYPNPPRFSGQTTQGSGTVFFPGSIQLGRAGVQMDANQFCREQGLREAVYAGQDNSSNLEDVLCRR